MATDDQVCTIVPYFKVPAQQHEAFRGYCERLVKLTSNEPGCLYYGFSFSGDEAHCREGYADGDAALAHLGNVGPLLGEVLKSFTMTRLEVHGPEAELSKLRGPMAPFNPAFFTLEYGFRR